MKVIWVTNGWIPYIAESVGLQGGNISWISSIIDGVSIVNDIELIYVFPQRKEKRMLEGDCHGIKSYGFFQPQSAPWKKDKRVVSQFREILYREQPDVVQIWGTEYAHALDCFNAVEELGYKERTIVYLQGFTSILGEQYYTNLPKSVCYSFSFRDLLRFDNIFFQKQKFLLRGINEKELITKAVHVIGRTDFDRLVSYRLNPSEKYHRCNESVRDAFWGHQWTYEKCEKDTIFLTQGYYPIKGMHMLVKAAGRLKRMYPQRKITIRVAGAKILYNSQRWRETTYGRYIRKLMKKEDVYNLFVFLGNLNANEMADELTRTNLFLLTSFMENSPNSLAEAMVVGTPCVVSNVGGVCSMFENGITGLLYNPENVEEMVEKILSILDSPDYGKKLSKGASEIGRQNHYSKNNINALMKIYDEVCRTE